MNNLSIFCADVGSISAKKFGWAAKISAQRELITGTEIEDFARQISEAIHRNEKVAIGFECPLFVPMRKEPKRVNSARNGEGNRSWSAGAGTGALATGLVEVLWVMNTISETLGYAPKAEFSWERFQANNGIFLWEAFVTASAKGLSHADDAVIGVNAFIKSLVDFEASNAISESSVLSLVGAAALRAKWTTDIEVLSLPCHVIKA
ncbi:hypothetical protein [Vibrio sp. THAF190c]|uniref:hypothetical protein n=1 Tax=Vibrio sp. THAF190c TaxID=2587865 RepID=UPI001268E4FA|nr:hypothetical protein [Vibrio sp. THAF190c]QFT12815.1 hypothetical protein FIV04_23030 [Vibrio sp. THAF190c]